MEVATRRRCLTKDAAVAFEFDDSKDSEFSVARTPLEGCYGKTYVVSFSLRDEHILATSEWEAANRSRALTLTLNDAGECQFALDGDGEYRRWQVARRMLCLLVFDDPPS